METGVKNTPTISHKVRVTVREGFIYVIRYLRLERYQCDRYKVPDCYCMVTTFDIHFRTLGNFPVKYFIYSICQLFIFTIP